MRGYMLIAAGSLLLGGCAGGGPAPSPFRGPVVSSVSMGSAHRPTPEPIGAEAETDDASPVRRAEPSPGPGPVVSRVVRAPTAITVVAYRGPRRSVRTVIAQAPSPAVTGNTPALMGKLRALVGNRDKRSNHLSFVLATLRQLGAKVPYASNAANLVKTARSRNAVMSTHRPRLGDIIVFDKFIRKKPHSLTAIVISVDKRGTVEFVYLARKIVRRGFMNLKRPRRKRDASGKVLNTIVRHLQSGDNRDRTPYLAGQLFNSYISLNKLTR